VSYSRPMIHLPPRRAVRPGGQEFIVDRPLETHWETISCKEAECPHYLGGWMTIVPTDSVQAEYIRHKSGRYFTEKKVEGGQSEFTFPPGQTCFGESHTGLHPPHRRPLDKQEIFIHRTMMGDRIHERPRDWTEHMNEETYKMQRERR